MRVTHLVALLTMTTTGCGYYASLEQTPPPTEQTERISDEPNSAETTDEIETVDTALLSRPIDGAHKNHGAGVENDNVRPDLLVESQVLRKVMLESGMKLSDRQQADLSEADLKASLDQVIVSLRKSDPEFLKLSKDAETAMREGNSLGNLDHRITRAEALFEEFDVKMGPLASHLLSEYKSGDSKLSSFQKELLAQLIRAEAKQLEYALSN